ncbi:MAG: hypothetical protein ABI687_05410 [Flavitalea sp.]
MQRLLFISFLFFSITSFGQKSDYILLKKKNNRTLKAYFPGTFISAVTYDGFGLNGQIKDIRHDTVFVQQQDVRQVMSRYGDLPALDTLVYTIGIFYKDINKFNYSSHAGLGGAPRPRGFAQVALPRVMLLGGLGYIVLESVNTLYRKDSFNDKGTITTLAVAAAVAGTGYLITRIQHHSQEAGGKFRVMYMKMN